MSCGRTSVEVPVAVFGDPVVGRALALLLRGPRYDTRFLSAFSPGELGSLKGIRLVLLTPTPGWSATRRECLVVAAMDGGIPILELVTSFVRYAHGEGGVEAGCGTIPWPCSTEELERRIEDALCSPPTPEGHEVQ